MSNFMKVRSVGTELFSADGQTDITKLIVAFHNSGNAPKNSLGCRAECYFTRYCSLERSQI